MIVIDCSWLSWLRCSNYSQYLRKWPHYATNARKKHCIALHGTAYFRFELLVPSLQHVSLGLVAPSLEEQHLQTSTSKLAQPVNFSKNLGLITGLTGLTAWHFSWLRLHETRETRETGTDRLDRLDRKPRRIPPPTREATLTTLVCCNLYFGRKLQRYAATIYIYNIYITSLSSVVRNYIQKSSAAIFRWS